MNQVAESNHAVADREEIDFDKAAGEFMFLGLRLTAGISTEAFQIKFGKTPKEFYPRIQTWIDGEFLEETKGHLRLTQKGMMVANSIFVYFM
jgi:coproporphyrinogen III oxidase-like Fe-S oxidoreductase